jgi:tetratricopeptide (TPR) repeat protein
MNELYASLNDTVLMKKIIFGLLTLCIGHATFGQTESEYYKSPIDSIFISKYLNEKRSITVILPKNFNKTKASKYPLIIVFDRQNKRVFREIFESINYLVSFDEMPEAIIIGISTENNYKRVLETSFMASMENAKGESLISFLYKELIPWAETELNCSTNRVFIGHSRFGYFTSYLLANKLNELTAVISCSPFFKEKNINVVDSLKSKLNTQKFKHTVYYRFITGDSLTDLKDYPLMKSFLIKAKTTNKFNWKGLEFYDARHMAVPGLAVMPSLLEVFDYWSDEMSKVLTESKKQFSRVEYEIFLQKMKIQYGDKIGLGLSVLNGIGFKYYNDKKYPEARQTWDIVLEEYPMFSDAYVNIANSYVKEGNKQSALEFYKKAKQNLTLNTFYSNTESQEILKGIEESIKTVQQ